MMRAASTGWRATRTFHGRRGSFDWTSSWTSGWLAGLVLLVCAMSGADSTAQVLDKRRLLEVQTFWDNRDWDWYLEEIPFFECPDEQLNTTYYYRWELLTKHLTYGSPNSGYSFTEFIDRPFWSGAFGAISCPAGHQLYEARWLRRPRIARDYGRYWLRTPGAQPRNYSTWLADSIWAVHQVHPDDVWVRELYPDLALNHTEWGKRHFVPEVELYWQTGHDDGMEFNINSRQTRDILRGAPSYRPSFNAYMWADAMALGRMADLVGDPRAAESHRAEAARLKDALQRKLWDSKRQFFFPMYRDDEQRDGHLVKALTRTYESGQFAGSPHGRELIGYVPWQFNLPDRGRDFEAAWKFLMDPDYFAAEFGPTTVERRDPLFHLSKSCCWWSGQSWPYATTQTLKALANLLQNYDQSHVTRDDYVRLLDTYSRSHRKQGRPYLAEALHPFTGSFEGHDGYNHSEHYFHSGFCDLVVTGLVGLQPQDDETLVLSPLAPATWDYFALEDVPYRGRRLTIVWDRLGTRYQLGQGLTVLVDGQPLIRQESLSPVRAPLPPRAASAIADESRAAGKVEAVNFAVNNEGHYYPRVTATFSASGTSVTKLIDGNYWYHIHPPNRWTCVGSPNRVDDLLLDLGAPRLLQRLGLYLLDDRENADGALDARLAAPVRIEVAHWSDGEWRELAGGRWNVERPEGHRANWFVFDPTLVSRIRIRLHHAPGCWSGLSEVEAWGNAELPVKPAPPPAGNLAYRPPGADFPRATASHTSRFDKVDSANDGLVLFAPTPNNRWTSYESPRDTDWLEIDLGKPVEFRRVELGIYDDRGGVQAPARYAVEYEEGGEFRAVRETARSPREPAGGQWNEVRFEPVTARRLRIVFTHRGPARSGVTEVMVWNDE